jgi:predicted Zn-dependent peptidase
MKINGFNLKPDCMHNSLFNKTILSNGIRVLSEEIPYVRSVALGVWIYSGSRNETIQTSGIAHFLEHMLFKGTKKRTANQIAESLESIGGSLDAFTTKEYTCYHAHFLNEHLPLAVDVISDIILNSLFEKTEIEKEKEVILKEINHTKETPDDMIFEYFYQNVFPSHPLGYHIFGTEKNVKRFSKNQLQNFLSQEYSAPNVIIVATGDVKHDQLVSLSEKLFSPLSPIQNNNRIIEPPPVVKSQQTIIQDSSAQAHVCFGSYGYAYLDEKKFAFMLLNILLGGGMSSILFQKLREEHGLVYTVFSFYDFFIDSGLWGIYFATDENQIPFAMDLIYQELNKLKLNLLDQQTFEKLKYQLKGNLILGLESTIARMNRLAKNELYLKNYYSLDSVLEKIDTVTREQIAAVAHEIYQEENYFSTILKPTI